MKKTIIAAVALLLIGCEKTSAPDQPQASTQPAALQNANVASTAAPSVALSHSMQQMTPSGVSQSQPQQSYIPTSMDPAEEPAPVVSVYVDFPEEQPAPILVDWAPPPMLVDAPPPPSDDDAVWTGGYWVWEGGWVWAHGRWSRPPHYGYRWNNPYYEYRDDGVVFINGFWCAPNAPFVTPPRNHIPRGTIVAGLGVGRRPEGPFGVFVPPPPGSHYGLIVPAPFGTPPAVVVGVPPMVRSGMHIVANNSVGTAPNVTVVAPANTTAVGHPLNILAPSVPHLAAAQRPLVNINAPEANPRSISSYQPGRASLVLPPPQSVQSRSAPNARQDQQIAVAPITPGAPPKPQVLEAPRATVTTVPVYQTPQPQQVLTHQSYEMRQPEQRLAQPMRVENNPPPTAQNYPQSAAPEERFVPSPPQLRTEQPQQRPAAPVSLPQQRSVQEPKPVTRAVKTEEKDKR